MAQAKGSQLLLEECKSSLDVIHSYNWIAMRDDQKEEWSQARTVKPAELR